MTDFLRPIQPGITIQNIQAESEPVTKNDSEQMVQTSAGISAEADAVVPFAVNQNSHFGDQTYNQESFYENVPQQATVEQKPVTVSILELFRAAKAEGKVPWTDRTVNRFLETKMTPSQYPKAFDDFKSWVRTNFFLTSTQHSELNSIDDADVEKVREAAYVAAELNKPLSFNFAAPKQTKVVDIVNSEENVKPKEAESSQKVWSVMGAVVVVVEIPISTAVVFNEGSIQENGDWTLVKRAKTDE